MAPATATQIDPSRLSKIQSLYSGSHPENGNGHVEACAMEAVAYIAGEPWSDHPECACPVLGAFMRTWNDNLPDGQRTSLLLPFIPRLVGTRGSKALEARRANMAADWYIRVFTPAWLRLAGLDKHADALASFPEITSFAKVPSLKPVLAAAQKDAEAAWSAAWSAARSAAESAAESAAWSAARSAAWSAAWSAARSAALAKLQSTSDELQKSALDLLDRMINAKDEDREAA